MSIGPVSEMEEDHTLFFRTAEQVAASGDIGDVSI
jgi:hypothetical protein